MIDMGVKKLMECPGADRECINYGCPHSKPHLERPDCFANCIWGFNPCQPENRLKCDSRGLEGGSGETRGVLFNAFVGIYPDILISLLPPIQ